MLIKPRLLAASMSFDFAIVRQKKPRILTKQDGRQRLSLMVLFFPFFLSSYFQPPEYLGVLFLISGPDLKRNTDLSADNIGFRKASHAPWFYIPVP